MKLENLSSTQGSRNHKAKRVGRGFGSGMGKTSTRGSKGQNSRKSGGTRLGFEGGQTPLYRRIPKIGFNNVNFSNDYNVVNLKLLIDQKLTKVDYKILVEKKLIIDNKLPIKIIGNNKIEKPIEIKADKFSKGAIKSLDDSKSKYIIINNSKIK